MSTHPADKSADNPRIQCVVCGKWKRLHLKAPRSMASGTHTQMFFGGCEWALKLSEAGLHRGENHLAQKDGDDDVCEPCCHIACKKIHDDTVAAALSNAGEKR